MRRGIIALLLLLTLAGCRPPITVQTVYLSHEHLASYHVGTPDPFINDPPIGQRLIISWNLPKKYTYYDDLHMELTVRLFTNEERRVLIPIKCRMGTYLYNLIDNDYFETCGVQTYKIDLYGSGCLLQAWRHVLWADLITFDN